MGRQSGTTLEENAFVAIYHLENRIENDKREGLNTKKRAALHNGL